MLTTNKHSVVLRETQIVKNVLCCLEKPNVFTIFIIVRTETALSKRHDGSENNNTYFKLFFKGQTKSIKTFISFTLYAFVHLQNLNGFVSLPVSS